MDFQGSDFSYCGYIAAGSTIATLCGSSVGIATGASFVVEANPSNSDLIATEGKVFGTIPSKCAQGSGTQAPTSSSSDTLHLCFAFLLFISIMNALIQI